MRSPQNLRDHIHEHTHGFPAERSALRVSDDKWAGYVLGVSEAIDALAADLRDEHGFADGAVGQAIADAQRQGLGIVGTARAVRGALALELAQVEGSNDVC